MDANYCRTGISVRQLVLNIFLVFADRLISSELFGNIRLLHQFVGKINGRRSLASIRIHSLFYWRAFIQDSPPRPCQQTNAVRRQQVLSFARDKDPV